MMDRLAIFLGLALMALLPTICFCQRGVSRLGLGNDRCPLGIEMAYLVNDNTKLDAVNSIFYSDITEETCAQMCADRKDWKGRRITCVSFEYDHVQKICTVHRERSIPDGERDLKEALGVRYFEKFCLPNEEDMSRCSEAHFFRAEQTVLIGYAKNVTIVPTLKECVAYCINEKEFICESAMYFYEEGECITNEASAKSQPNDFAQEDTDRVTYFENGCLSPVSYKNRKNEKTNAGGRQAVQKEPAVELKSSTQKFVEPKSGSPPKSKPIAKLPPVPKTRGAAPRAQVIPNQLTPVPSVAATKPTVAQQPTATTATGAAGSSAAPATAAAPTSRTVASAPPPAASQTTTGRVAKTIGTTQWTTQSTKSSKTAAEPVPPGYTRWGKWSRCDRPDGRRVRRRNCVSGTCSLPLLQVQWCAEINPDELTQSTSAPVTQTTPKPIAKPTTRRPTVIVPARIQAARTFQQSKEQQKPKGAWGPWEGQCQPFANTQPCNNGVMIGFETRRCAGNPFLCQGPFFRYCTLTC